MRSSRSVAAAALGVTLASQWLISSSSASGSRPAAAAPSRAQVIFSATRANDRSRTASRAELAGAEAGVDADDVGLATGQPQHAGAASTDEDRRVRLLHWFGQPVEGVHLVVLTAEVERPGAEQSLHHRDRFREPAHAHSGRVERDARRLVVGGHPPGSEPQHHAPVGDDVQQGGHAVDEDGMAVVVAEHAGLQPQRRRRAGRRGERDHRFERVAAGEVVGRDHRPQAEVLEAAQRGAPLGDGSARRRHRGREPEGVRAGHAVSSACTNRRPR